jgi:hypothetical protein
MNVFDRMKAIYLALLLMISCFASAQKSAPVCKCPKTFWVAAGAKPAKIFHFSNNRSIGLYGGADTEIIKGKTLYSEFVLAACGAKKIIKFWGAMLTCDVKMANDTLYVNTLYPFPIGKAMKPHYIPWTIELIYFTGSEATRDSLINPNIPKYTPAQIARVFSQYQHTPNANNDTTIDLAEKLFISTLSGSKKAKYYLLNFHKKFTTLDGVYQEEYDTIMRMLKLWEKMSVQSRAHPSSASG